MKCQKMCRKNALVQETKTKIWGQYIDLVCVFGIDEQKVRSAVFNEHSLQAKFLWLPLF